MRTAARHNASCTSWDVLRSLTNIAFRCSVLKCLDRISDTQYTLPKTAKRHQVLGWRYRPWCGVWHKTYRTADICAVKLYDYMSFLAAWSWMEYRGWIGYPGLCSPPINLPFVVLWLVAISAAYVFNKEICTSPGTRLLRLLILNDKSTSFLSWVTERNSYLDWIRKYVALHTSWIISVRFWGIACIP